MQIIENKAVLVTTRHPHRITEIIPKSKVIEQQGDKYRVMVHWGLQEAQVLKNLNFKGIMSPIIGRYNWPGVFKPFEHQKVTASFCTLNKRCFVLNDPGTCKTASAAWAADYLMNLKLVKRVLVVCPLSIMETAWQADLFRTVMHRDSIVCHGNKEKRAAAINSGAEFVITNYDSVVGSLAEFEAAQFDLIIVDESSYIQNIATQRWKAIHKLVKPDTWLWLMTGTPAAQSPTNAYGLVKLVSPSSVPRTFGLFRDLVMTKVTHFKYAPRLEASTIVHNLMQPAIRYTKAECLDLPPVLYTTRDVPMTPQQLKYYKEIKKNMLIHAAGEEVTAVNAAVLLGKLLQIATGSVYSTTKEVVEFDVSGRYNALIEVIEQSQQKILVAAPYTHNIEMLKRRLVEDGYSVGVISGNVPAGQRAELIRNFQTQDEPRIMILQPQAASHGLTLTRADTIVWWAPVTSLETYIQFNARIDRNGQINNMTVVHLQGSPVEKKLYDALQNRKVNHDMLLNLYKQEVDNV
jgi:SNF2 family DNA or RNA helicase